MKVKLTNNLLSKDFKAVEKVKKISQSYMYICVYKYVSIYIKYVLRDI